MNIAQEIYESIQELYQEIIKVDLKTGKATILHSITDPSDRGKECIWDSQLEKYMKNKIQPSDHERMRDNFCLRHLRNECEKGKGLFSNNFSTMNGKLPDNHVTVLAFAPGNDSQEKVYILLRKAGQEYFMWSAMRTGFMPRPLAEIVVAKPASAIAICSIRAATSTRESPGPPNSSGTSRA